MIPEELESLKEPVSGRYAIQRELGRGGVAVVYLADDLTSGGPVALKVLRPEFAASMGADRFIREIEFTTSLQHERILPLLDSGQTGALPYYVMPYVEAGSLRDVLNRERSLRLEAAIMIAAEVAEALDYAHAQGIVHRDIKPDNILFEDGHAVVSDFGLARAVAEAAGERLTKSGVAMGTPAYMSPEQAGDAKVVDGRTDVYALGCMVYEMLTGEPPFTGSTQQAILAKHMQQPIPELRVLRSTLPLALQPVLETALAKMPSDRYRSAGDFVRALASASSGRTARQQRLLRLSAAAAGLVILAPLLVLGMRWLRGLQDGAAAAPLDPRHIAVLYFDDLTPAKALGYVAAGLTEDLIDELSQVSVLHVIAPNGVRPYQGRAARVDSLARSLQVGTIVTGSLASVGDQLRVKVRLIEAPSGRQLEVASLDQSRDKLLVLQDTIASRVALVLRERLGQEIRLKEHRAGTKSARAWELVKQAQALNTEGSALIRANEAERAAPLLWSAESLLVKAEALDPTWIQPTVSRGWTALNLAFVSPGPDSSARGEAPARPPIARQSGLSAPWILRGIAHAEAALRRSPDDPEALAQRGDFRRWLVIANHPGADTLLPLAEADLRTALSARPDLARSWYALSYVYYRQARFADAARAAKRALDADAFLTEMSSVISMLFLASLNLENLQDARGWCRLGMERDPLDPRFADCELIVLGYWQRGPRSVRDAWTLVHDIEQRDSTGALSATWAYRRIMVAAVLARSGMPDSARAVIARAKTEQSAHGGNADLRVVEAYVRELLGETVAAVRLLEQYLSSAPHERAYVARSPWYRGLHSDPRFQAMVRAPS